MTSPRYKGWYRGRGDATHKDVLVVSVGGDDRQLHISDSNDVDTDFNLAAQCHPLVVVHSATTPATDYISLQHNATSGFLNVAGGTLALQVSGTTEVTLPSTVLDLAGVNLQLQCGGDILDNGGNESLSFVTTACAVNEFTLTNAAACGNPALSVTGGDTNISMEFATKGTGWYHFASPGTTVGHVAAPMHITTQVTTAGAATYTAAHFRSGIICRDPNGAARCDVTPTAALLVADIPGADVGTSYFVALNNAGAATENVTVTAGTGVTLDGTTVVNDGKTGLFLVTFTNVTACSEAVTMFGLSCNA